MSVRPGPQESVVSVEEYTHILTKDRSPLASDTPYASRPVNQSTRPTNPTRSSTRSAKSSARATEKAKANPAFDVIDRLDISGLYGGGAFHRHDGPYAAATAHANRGPRAPINAFDPATLALSAKPPPSRRQGVSARAQAAMAAMGQSFDGPSNSSIGAHSMTGLRRRNSDSSLSSVTLGYPTRTTNASGKQNAQLTEMFGVRDEEAWQDYGRGRSAARESAMADGGQGGVTKEDRMARAISVWDMEQTLKAGKPVAAAPPPMPVMPTQFSDGPGQADGRPKRSKSLVGRFRRGRKDSSSASFEATPPVPPSPTIERNALSVSMPPSFHRSQTDVPKRTNYSPTSPIGFAPLGAGEQDEHIVYAGGQRNEGGVRFQAGTGLTNSKSEGASVPMARKRSLMQKLFGKKAD